MTGFALIETLRWQPGDGFLRGARHLNRLAASADELGFAFDRPAVEEALRDAVSGSAPLRVRAELASDGAVSVVTAPYLPVPRDTVWRLRIASARLASGDRLLRHKTTRRETYTAARAEFAATDADEVLLVNERGEICEGTITSVFARPFAGSPLVTPPLSCGLLAGVLRAELLETGEAVEGVLAPEALRAADELFAGNSLRGLVRARLD